MSIREKLHGLLSGNPRSEQVAASENPRDISVQFYDLREARADHLNRDYTQRVIVNALH